MVEIPIYIIIFVICVILYEKWAKYDSWKAILLLIATILVAFLVGQSQSRNKTPACECFEVVGDEESFVCYTPLGEVDTKGECVGHKAYKW